jgi:hypothetical protein
MTQGLGNGRCVAVGSRVVHNDSFHGGPTPKIMKALAGLGARGLTGVRAAAFDTRVKLFIHGDAAKKITRALQDAGASIVARPMPFYVKGSEGPLLPREEERATVWAERILAALKDQESYGEV